MALLTYADMALAFGSDAAGCPELVLERHLRNVVNELCSTAQIYRVTLQFNTAKGVADYPLSLPTDTRLEAVKYVVYDERLLQYVPARESVGFDNGHPVNYTVDHAGVLKLLPTPVEDGRPVICEVAVKPTRNATGVDEYFFDAYFDAIYHGTLSRVFSMPNEAWYNRNRAVEHFAAYNEHALDAGRKADGKKQSRKRVSRFQW